MASSITASFSSALERTGRINQSSARFKRRQSRSQQRNLPRMKLRQILRPQRPSNFRIPPQSPSPRARCIDKHARKLLAKGKRTRSIQFHNGNAAQSQPFEMRPNRRKPMRVTIRRNNAPARTRGLGERRRLPPRRRAQIQHRIARAAHPAAAVPSAKPHPESKCAPRETPRSAKCFRHWREKNSLSQRPGKRCRPPRFEPAHNFIALRRIMNQAGKLGRPIVSFEQRDCLRLAEARQPALDKPGGMRMKNSKTLGEQGSWKARARRCPRVQFPPRHAKPRSQK